MLCGAVDFPSQTTKVIISLYPKWHEVAALRMHCLYVCLRVGIGLSQERSVATE